MFRSISFAICVIVSIGVLSCAASAQSGNNDLARLAAEASRKGIFEIESAAGKTPILVMSPSANPRFVFVFSQGGDGKIQFANENGTYTSPTPSTFGFALGVNFLKNGSAWVVVGLPPEYKHGLSQTERQNKAHIDAFAKVGQVMKASYPKSKVILIGHSNGGITAAAQAVQTERIYDGVVLSAPNSFFFPSGWQPDHANVPIMFITHKDDMCSGTEASRTIQLAQGKAPLVIIEKTSPGNSRECYKSPAQHFYSNVVPEVQNAILQWAASLK